MKKTSSRTRTGLKQTSFSGDRIVNGITGCQPATLLRPLGDIRPGVFLSILNNHSPRPVENHCPRPMYSNCSSAAMFPERAEIDPRPGGQLLSAATRDEVERTRRGMSKCLVRSLGAVDQKQRSLEVRAEEWTERGISCEGGRFPAHVGTTKLRVASTGTCRCSAYCNLHGFRSSHNTRTQLRIKLNDVILFIMFTIPYDVLDAASMRPSTSPAPTASSDPATQCLSSQLQQNLQPVAQLQILEVHLESQVVLRRVRHHGPAGPLRQGKARVAAPAAGVVFWCTCLARRALPDEAGRRQVTRAVVVSAAAAVELLGECTKLVVLRAIQERLQRYLWARRFISDRVKQSPRQHCSCTAKLTQIPSSISVHRVWRCLRGEKRKGRLHG
ncbi:hypothetical protein EYF80_031492 [Liparis tanakae]|uniref:Uncharacterized protein n=1 Tax=Liparis tanakae TaxID=230148 RepID=A0A4Z2GXZ1_9TELE|nr:hypothetical protein EYF80_031492 [Liparis tanakae]